MALGGLGDVIQARGQPHLRHPHLKEEAEGRGVNSQTALSRVEAGIWARVRMENRIRNREWDRQPCVHVFFCHSMNPIVRFAISKAIISNGIEHRTWQR